MTDSATQGNFAALVIDDEHYVREFVSDVLRAEGWNVFQSTSAEDAFQRLNEAPWSVVFCDVILGGENGYSVLRTFKEKLPEAKVVLMTGHGSSAGALDARALKLAGVAREHQARVRESLADEPERLGK